MICLVKKPIEFLWVYAWVDNINTLQAFTPKYKNRLASTVFHCGISTDSSLRSVPTEPDSFLVLGPFFIIIMHSVPYGDVPTTYSHAENLFFSANR